MDLRERESILEELRSEDDELRRLAVERLSGVDAETADYSAADRLPRPIGPRLGVI